MIIGISGKSGSGKDTVGKMLQYLSCIDFEKFNKLVDPSSPTGEVDMFKNYRRDSKIISKSSVWEIKKFADPIKDIVSYLLKVNKVKLEDQEFKNKPLDEKWTRYGYADGFSHVYKGGEKVETIMNNKQCNRDEYEAHRRINWQTAYKSVLTPRRLMQLVGTEFGRNIINEHIWINLLASDYERSYSNNFNYKNKGVYEVDEKFEIDNPPKYPNWIITDVRFKNEADFIKGKGGLIIKLNTDKDKINKGITNKSETNHQSETETSDIEYDINLNNIGSLKDLFYNTKEIYKDIILPKYLKDDN